MVSLCGSLPCTIARPRSFADTACVSLRLYSRGYRAFTDVVSGSSAGCGTTGFPAAKGWDAVTGFGTPVSLAQAFHHAQLKTL